MEDNRAAPVRDNQCLLTIKIFSHVKVQVDNKRRVTLPKGVAPGDVYDIQTKSVGHFLLIRMEVALPESRSDDELINKEARNKILRSLDDTEAW